MNTLHLEKTEALTKAIDYVNHTGDAILLEMDGKQECVMVPKSMIALIESMENYLLDRIDLAEIEARQPHERETLDYSLYRDELLADHAK